VLAQGVDLLIHEATYSEALKNEANDYGHSTAGQAAATARDAGARKLLITHFSSRFPDPIVLLEEAQLVFPQTIMAEDLMSIEV
jgi:ribonuclease Z